MHKMEVKMETQIQVFNNSDFGDVRTIIRDGEPWFVAADVCRALDVDSTATRRLDDDEKGLHSTQTLGGEQNMTIVNEPGLYSLVLSSRKPEAKAFKRWITHDVIPAIRRHGMYAIDDIIANPDLGIAALQALKEEREKRQALESTVAVQSQQIAELAPKASYYDIVLNCKDLMSISKIAKDYGKSAIWLNDKLAELKVQYKQDGVWLLIGRGVLIGATNAKYERGASMPRLPLTKAQRQRLALVRTIDGYIGERRRAGAGHREIAMSLGLGYTTLREKLAKPERFRLDEIQHIANVLNVSISQLLGEVDV